MSVTGQSESKTKGLKLVKRYEVRFYPFVQAFSRGAGRKLYERTRALRIVRRLKRSGVDAFVSPMMIRVST